MKITKIHAREVLNSRGNPTVEAEVTIDDKICERAIVPSGASPGEKEAVELKDGDTKRYNGKGVMKAVDNVNNTITSHCIHKTFDSQQQWDKTLIALDGTENKASGCRSERVAKFNQLLRIEEALGDAAGFAGIRNLKINLKCV